MFDFVSRQVSLDAFHISPDTIATLQVTNVQWFQVWLQIAPNFLNELQTQEGKIVHVIQMLF